MEEAIRDLANRWHRARKAALRGVVPTAQADDEDGLLAAALAQDPEQCLRRVFENSLVLGSGFARFRRRPLTLDELTAALPDLGSPCLSGEVRAAEPGPAVYLEREGCPAGRSPALCDYWREAVFGLVLGATGGVRHTRHESLGRGGSRCVDLLHQDPESPLRFGPLPEALRPALDRAARLARAFDSAAELRFLGLSEGVLLYELVRGTGLDLREQVERVIHRSHPEIELREISPRPVMGD